MADTHRGANGLSAGVAPFPAADLAASDLPPLSEEDQVALSDIRKKQGVLRDLALGCVAGSHTGACVYGQPGVGKTHAIHNTLRGRGACWRLPQLITAKPLYLELEKHPGAVHVVDDCEQLFGEKSALTRLRSALGGERVNGRRERRVSDSVSGANARVMEFYFYGSIIFTSNRPPVQEKPEVAAILSRVPTVGYSPTDRKIRALMRDAARRGYAGEGGTMSPQECVEVVEHVIEAAGELKSRLDLRWIEHGYAHYLTHAARGARSTGAT